MVVQQMTLSPRNNVSNNSSTAGSMKPIFPARGGSGGGVNNTNNIVSSNRAMTAKRIYILVGTAFVGAAILSMQLLSEEVIVLPATATASSSSSVSTTSTTTTADIVVDRSTSFSPSSSLEILSSGEKGDSDSDGTTTAAFSMSNDDGNNTNFTAQILLSSPSIEIINPSRTKTNPVVVDAEGNTNTNTKQDEIIEEIWNATTMPMPTSMTMMTTTATASSSSADNSTQQDHDFIFNANTTTSINTTTTADATTLDKSPPPSSIEEKEMVIQNNATVKDGIIRDSTSSSSSSSSPSNNNNIIAPSFTNSTSSFDDDERLAEDTSLSSVTLPSSGSGSGGSSSTSSIEEVPKEVEKSTNTIEVPPLLLLHDDDDDHDNDNNNSNYTDVSSSDGVVVVQLSSLAHLPVQTSTNSSMMIIDDDDDNNNSNTTTNNKDPVRKIILLGERHSGTNWITDYLTGCFDIKVSNQYKRFKHWFQEEDITKVPYQSAVVIVLFRDPYDWVEAMRIEPHHAHDHLAWYKPYDPAKKVREMAKPLPWKEFVTKPWIGRRGKHDEQIRKKNQNNNGGIQNATCMDHYTYVDVAPCLALDSIYVKGLADYKYELRHDGSERGYPSIIDLRRDKIKNMLSVSNFTGTRSFFSFQYEDLNWNGTSILLRSIEEATGLKAKCNATMGKNHGTSSTRNRRRHLRKKTIRAHDALPDDFIQWMNRYVDWEVEGKIGYTRRGGGVANGGGPSSSSTKKETTTTTSLIVKESSPKPTTTMTPVQQIVLLGERHSGTNWITTYLKECFDITVSDEYKRFKHWFQEEDLDKVPEQSTVVVAMFRDPYDWVEAMRIYPHHSHDHLQWSQPHTKISTDWQAMASPLGWKAFVTKPWIGRRGPNDKKIGKSKEKRNNIICMDNYTYVDAAPCTIEDSPFVKGLGQYKYEYQHDGSERGFSSIIDLRRDKIENILSVADFRGTRAFFPFRYEDLDANGTSSLLRSVEEATGLTAKCNATMGKAITTYNALPNDYIRWMNEYVDWDMESRIGYSKRGLNG